jgi:hypothetical protein
MRALLKLTIGLVVLGGLLVGADRVAVGVAEDQAAQQLVSSGRMSSRPNVSISGFPFLTQAMAGEFDGVTLSADGVTVNDGQEQVPLRSFKAQLSGVTVSDSYRSATVRSGSGTAVIAYQDLAGLVQGAGHLDLSYGGPGKVQASMAGVAIGTGQLHNQGNTVIADGFQLSGLAKLLAGSSSALLHPQSFTLSDLPAGLNLASVTPQQDGVLLDFQGSNLKLIG